MAEPSLNRAPVARAEPVEAAIGRRETDERVARPDRLAGIGDGEFRRRALLQLQASHGNTAVRSLIRASRPLQGFAGGALQRQPTPDTTPKPGPTATGGPTTGGPTTGGPTTTTPAPTLSKPIDIKVGRGAPIRFGVTSASGDIGLATVQVTGRLGLLGKAAFPGTPPAKDPQGWARSELEKAAIAAVTGAAPTSPAPTASPVTVNLSIGGQSLSVVLSSKADLNRGFHVFARVSGPGGKAPATYNFGGIEFTGAASIDVEIVFTPKKAAKAPADPSIGEEYLTSLSFAGTAGDTGHGKGRNVALAGDDSVAAIDKLLPDKVKKDSLLSTPAARRNFLAFMRPWFGSDAATLAHFAKIELVDVPNKGSVFLHSDAKTRLEAVQADIGPDVMPHNNGVAWSFRDAFDFSGAQNHANMHTLGLAVDYDAYANPRLADERLHQLIRTVTGRSHHLKLGDYTTRRKLIKKMGDTTAGTDEEAKKKSDASKEVTDFFTLLESEVTALAAASTAFKASLGTGATKLADLKKQYIAAVKMKDKDAKAAEMKAIAKELPATLKPWLDAITAREAEAQKQAGVFGVTDLGKLGEKADLTARLKALQDAGKSIGALKTKADKAKKEPKLTKTERKQLAASAVAIGSTFDPETAEADLPTALDRLVKEAAAAAGPVSADLALYAKKPAAAGEADVGDLKGLWNSLQRLRDALNDPAFVFPEAEGKGGLKVSDPAASQLLEMGYFNLREPKGKMEAFNLVFMKSMVKHGFELGAAWGESDPMHFELIVKAPTEK